MTHVITEPDVETLVDQVRPSPIRGHRSPRLIGLGVALVAIGGLGAAWLATSLASSVSVVVAVDTIERGQVLTASDLAGADISLDPSLSPMAASNIEDLIGQHAQLDIPAGSLVTAEAVTTDPLPVAGQSIVPIAVPGTGLPAQDLRPGSPIRLVDTPRDGDEPPLGTPGSFEATVVETVLDEETGFHVVTVTVPSDIATRVAAHAATGRVAIVLDSEVGP